MRFHLLSAAAVALILFFLLRHLDPSRLSTTIGSADWSLVIVAALLNLVVNSFGRIIRFATLLSAVPCEGKRPGLRELTPLLIATRALNLVLPAKAGETLRAFQLKRRHGFALESVLATIFLESIIEALALGLAAIMLLLAGGLPREASSILYKLIAAGAVILIAFAGLSRFNPHAAPARWKSVASRFADSLGLLNSPSLWLKSLAWTWLADFIDLLTIGLCLRAIGIYFGPIEWFVVLAAVNIAIVLPAVPGNIGTLEAGAILALGIFGIDRDRALAFSILYHSAHMVPIGLVGAISLAMPNVGIPKPATKKR